jgi:hypothetical protein
MRWILVAAYVVSAVPAWAQDNRAVVPADASASGRKRAADLFDRATAFYRIQKWESAAEHFEQANRIVSNPTTAEFAVRSHLNAGHLDRAATLAALAQRRYPQHRDLSALCSSVLARATAELSRVYIDCRRPCKPTVDHRAIDSDDATPPSLYLAPGEHSFKVEFDGGSAEQQTLISVAGETRHLVLGQDATNAAAATPNPAAVSDPTDRQVAQHGLSPLTFWFGVGLTAVAAGATTYSAIDTINHPGTDRIREECAKGDVRCPAYREGLANQRRTNYLIGATTLLGVSTVAIGLFFTDWKGPEARPSSAKRRPRRVTIAPLAVDARFHATGGLHLELRGQF